MKIPFSTLTVLHSEIKNELIQDFESVLEKGWFIQGEMCKLFENSFADYCGVKHCVGCGNGLDSISIALQANGVCPGDEVIVPAQTFVATALAVERVGAKPILVDVEDNTTLMDCNLIEDEITDKTKAIVPVHLYGQPVNINAIMKIAKEYDLKVIFDAAQAHGATYNNEKIGKWGNASCFSFYPGKNLGALGDGGAIITNDSNYEEMKKITNYGSSVRYHHDVPGINSRLDELQAAFLNTKLKYLDKMLAERKKIAKRYLKEIDNPQVELPKIVNTDHVWHIFAIHVDKRNYVQTKLQEKGIETNIHYPIPIHLQKVFAQYKYKKEMFPVAEKMANSELSLPLYYGMTEDEQSSVIDAINKMVFE